MNYLQYLESKFVTSRLQQNSVKKGDTQIAQRSENEAILALMWVALKFVTLFHLITIPFKFLLVALHVTPKPQLAGDIVAAAQAAASKDKDMIASVTAGLKQDAAIKAAMKIQGEAATVGMKKGSA